MPRTRPRTTKAQQAAMQEEMHKFKTGALHSGSADGPVVTDRDQAIAIALSVSGQGKRRKGSIPGVTRKKG